MSKRLQVVMDDEEWEEFRAEARRQGMTLSDWVRRALRESRRRAPQGDLARRLDAVRAAGRHEFPAPDIDTMLEEIERGYTTGS